MKRAVALLALGIVVVAGWSWLRSDRPRIERTLARLERACTKEGPESPLALLGRTETILDAFAPGFLVLARPYEGSISDGRELAGAIHRYRALAQRVRVRDAERKLEVSANGTAEMSVVFLVDGDRGGRPGAERFRARLFWVEHEGEWRIREFEIVEVLDRSGLFL